VRRGLLRGPVLTAHASSHACRLLITEQSRSILLTEFSTYL
jgi:hypothetical protein